MRILNSIAFAVAVSNTLSNSTIIHNLDVADASLVRRGGRVEVGSLDDDRGGQPKAKQDGVEEQEAALEFNTNRESLQSSEKMAEDTLQYKVIQPTVYDGETPPLGKQCVYWDTWGSRIEIRIDPSIRDIDDGGISQDHSYLGLAYESPNTKRRQEALSRFMETGNLADLPPVQDDNRITTVSQSSNYQAINLKAFLKTAEDLRNKRYKEGYTNVRIRLVNIKHEPTIEDEPDINIEKPSIVYSSSPKSPVPKFMNTMKDRWRRFHQKYLRISIRKNSLPTLNEKNDLGSTRRKRRSQIFVSKKADSQKRHIPRDSLALITAASSQKTSNGSSTGQAQFERILAAFQTTQSVIANAILPSLHDITSQSNATILSDMLWALYSYMTASSQIVSGPFLGQSHCLDSLEDEFQKINNLTESDPVFQHYLVINAILLQWYQYAYTTWSAAVNATGAGPTFDTLVSRLLSSNASILPPSFSAINANAADDTIFGA